jgi:hypothetical protein
MTKVKYLEEYAKLQSQIHGMNWKVLLEGIQIWNTCMKALLPTNQKSWPRLMYAKRPNSKVKRQRVKVIFHITLLFYKYSISMHVAK